MKSQYFLLGQLLYLGKQNKIKNQISLTSHSLNLYCAINCIITADLIFYDYMYSRISRKK